MGKRMKDIGYVVKNSDGLYFIGNNQVSSKLRKALIYHSEKYAKDCIKALSENPNIIFGVRRDFGLVKVEIQEI